MYPTSLSLRASNGPSTQKGPNLLSSSHDREPPAIHPLRFLCSWVLAYQLNIQRQTDKELLAN